MDYAFSLLGISQAYVSRAVWWAKGVSWIIAIVWSE
jgi:hypothetical protein